MRNEANIIATNMDAAAAIRAEIASKVRQRNEWNVLGLSDWDSDAEIAAEIVDLEGELEVIERPELYA